MSLCGIAKRHLKPSCEIEAQEKSRGAVLEFPEKKLYYNNITILVSSTHGGRLDLKNDINEVYTTF